MRKLFTRKQIVSAKPEYFSSGKALGYYYAEIVGHVLIESAIRWGGSDITSLKTFDGTDIHSGCTFETGLIHRTVVRKLASYLTQKEVIGMSLHGGMDLDCVINQLVPKFPQKQQSAFSVYLAMGLAAHTAFQLAFKPKLTV